MGCAVVHTERVDWFRSVFMPVISQIMELRRQLSDTTNIILVSTREAHSAADLCVHTDIAVETASPPSTAHEKNSEKAHSQSQIIVCEHDDVKNFEGDQDSRDLR